MSIIPPQCNPVTIRTIRDHLEKDNSVNGTKMTSAIEKGMISYPEIVGFSLERNEQVIREDP